MRVSRFTWDPQSPAPFESAWSVFAKLMALNFVKPGTIVAAIKHDSIEVPSKNVHLLFRDSSWIDFDRFGKALNVEPARLRTCFLDQLDFPHIDRHENEGIRICPECLAKGFHSTFFELGILAQCPWHERILEKSCAHCFEAIYQRGLQCDHRSSKHNNYIQLDDEDLGLVYRYESTCKHISFTPSHIQRTNLLSKAEEALIRDNCQQFLLWWQKISSSSMDGSFLASSLALNRVSNEDLDDLSLRLGVAEKIAGRCPWVLRTTSKPASWVAWSQSASPKQSFPHEVSRESEFGVIYKAIRRHLYKRHVRLHRVCWKEVSNLPREWSQALGSLSVCSMALGFASWRMSIEGFSNVEGFKSRGISKTKLRVLIPMNENFVSTIKTAAYYWYAQFFGVLGNIESKKLNESFFIYRQIREAYDPPGIVWSFMQHGVEPERALIPAGQWWLAFPQPEFLVFRTELRCYGRVKGKNHMVDPRSTWNTTFWAYQDKADSMFKVKSTSWNSILSRSYSYIYV